MGVILIGVIVIIIIVFAIRWVDPTTDVTLDLNVWRAVKAKVRLQPGIQDKSVQTLGEEKSAGEKPPNVYAPGSSVEQKSTGENSPNINAPGGVVIFGRTTK